VLCFLWLSYFIVFKLQRPFQEFHTSVGFYISKWRRLFNTSWCLWLSLLRCTWIICKIDSINEFITNFDKIKIPASEHFIVQEYVEKPFLLDGYKFDLRIYVLITSCDPLRVFLFNDGLVRMSTEKYTNGMLVFCGYLTSLQDQVCQWLMEC
jgi:hypothetical protein